MKTHIIDYGRSNLRSVCRAIERCGGEFVLVSDPKGLDEAERVILPGVGAFGDCAEQLGSMGLSDALVRYAESGRPLLGICVGMQILHSVGEEFGEHAGLGLIEGRVSRIPATDANGRPHKTPHIGWTALELPEGRNEAAWENTILAPIVPGATVYFVHSYTAWPEDPGTRLADANYNGRLISAAVMRDNVVGVQFHPEKSGPVGLRIIRAFLDL